MVLKGVLPRRGPLLLLLLLLFLLICCISQRPHTGDLASTFHLFITPTVENIILEMTNREGRRKYGDEWKGMDETDLRAYIGLLILVGVYRSRGEAAARLWDAESGWAIFCATMPLKLFHTYSRLLRFDDCETRRMRRATDKLAAVREVWDTWVAWLLCLYNPGPEVTVEQLVPFRVRCPFRQYMPSKPAKYGIKSWVSCDAKSSYAWKMQVYTGKPSSGRPERNQGLRVVLDVMEGLHGRYVTCDNYFTSYKFVRQLLERKLTVVGTVQKNKPELPTGLLAVKGREVFSSKFAAPLVVSKRKRCQICPRKKDCKTHTVCHGCNKYICKGCSLVYCPKCAS